MAARDAITLLHVSDLQFGRNHRFGNLAAGDPDAEFDTLFTRLDDDLKLLAKRHGLVPEVIVASGDLAEWGLKKEFDDAFEFLDRLATSLDVPRGRVVVVPGNHDVNRKRCESYFLECESEGDEPVAPYVPKWEATGGGSRSSTRASRASSSPPTGRGACGPSTICGSSSRA